jgi:hypothetical protein
MQQQREIYKCARNCECGNLSTDSAINVLDGGKSGVLLIK